MALTPKAFDTLLILIEKGGRLIEKEELMKQLWPNTFVEESSLSQNIYLVRKALGEESQGARYIETVPRRGYRFIALVREVSGGDTAMVEGPGAHILAGGNESPAGTQTIAPALSPPLRRFSRTLLFGLASALTLLAIVFAVQDAILEQVARALKLKLTTDERKHLTWRPTENPEAYQTYARGLFFWNRRTEDGRVRLEAPARTQAMRAASSSGTEEPKTASAAALSISTRLLRKTRIMRWPGPDWPTLMP
ncbi:MAG: winged helix-turn-helix domain-containing protein [Blastocatellia bacterium]